MSDLFRKLEAQQRVNNEKCVIGATIGVALGYLAIKLIDGSPDFIAYLPAVLDSIPGAMLASGIIDFEERRRNKEKQ